MDIKDIYKIHKDKQRENKKIYKMVLDIIHERILDIAHMNGNQFFYIIPMFVEEKPIFNMREARRSIAHQLKKEGFISPASLIPYHEFHWGNWLRKKPLPPFNSKNLSPALSIARKLACSHGASHLKGWKGSNH